MWTQNFDWALAGGLSAVAMGLAFWMALFATVRRAHAEKAPARAMLRVPA